MEATSSISPNTSGKKSKSFPIWNVLFIVLMVVAFGIFGYLFINQRAKVKALEEAQKEMALTAISGQTQQEEVQNAAKFAAYQALYGKRSELLKTISPSMVEKLSPEGQKSYELIILQVDKNPELLGTSYDRFPPELQKAVDDVKKELYANNDIQSYGNIPLEKLDNPKTPATPEVGDTAAITGILEVEAEDSPLGTVFSVFDEEYQMPFYFTFNEPNTQKAMEYVGEEVEFIVEITKIDPEKGVLYEVVSGPKAI